MTLFYSRHDEPRGSRFPVARVCKRLSPLFKAIHEAIVAAKIQRLRSELAFRSSTHENWTSGLDDDAAKMPRRPLILGDKWDF